MRHTLKFRYPIGAQFLEKVIPLDNGHFSWDSSGISASLGNLEVFPVEVLVNILLQLDLPTLTTFRLVNRLAMTTLDTVPQYRFIAQNHPYFIRAAVATQARSFNLDHLFAQLRLPDESNPKCRGEENCSHHGVFLWLLTGDLLCRCCHDNRKLMSRNMVVHEHLRGVDNVDAALEKLPQITSMPLFCTPWNPARTSKPRVLFDSETVNRHFPVTRCRCKMSHPEHRHGWYQVAVRLDLRPDSPGSDTPDECLVVNRSRRELASDEL
jgi:hypothetical protein